MINHFQSIEFRTVIVIGRHRLFFCSFVGLLSLWHIPHFHSQFYVWFYMLQTVLLIKMMDSNKNNGPFIFGYFLFWEIATLCTSKPNISFFFTSLWLHQPFISLNQKFLYIFVLHPLELKMKIFKAWKRPCLQRMTFNKYNKFNLLVVLSSIILVLPIVTFVW